MTAADVSIHFPRGESHTGKNSLLKWKITAAADDSLSLYFTYQTDQTSLPGNLIQRSVLTLCNEIMRSVHYSAEVGKFRFMIEDFMILFVTETHSVRLSVSDLVDSDRWDDVYAVSYTMENIMSGESEYNTHNLLPDFTKDFPRKANTALKNFDTAFKLTCDILNTTCITYRDLQLHLDFDTMDPVEENIIKPKFDFSYSILKNNKVVYFNSDVLFQVTLYGVLGMSSGDNHTPVMFG